MTLEGGLRELIADVVRAEVRKALADLRAPDEHLTVRAAAAVASVAPGTIRRWLREGRLRGEGAGRLLRVRRSVLEAMLVEDRHVVDTPESLAGRDFGR